MYIYNPRPGRSYSYRSPVQKASLINSLIIAANVIVYIIISIIGSTYDTELMLEWGASYWPLIRYGHEYYRLFTSAFLHFGFSHLFGNMLVLAFIGDNLERALGKVKYLIFYVLCAVGSGAVSFLVSMLLEENVVSAGASGAIFGVAGGILYVLIVNRGQLEDLTSFQIFMFIIFTLYQGMRSSGVDNVAHLSGVFFGFVLAALFYHPWKQRPRRRQW